MYYFFSNNSKPNKRIWNWIAQEAPVAGNQFDDGTEINNIEDNWLRVSVCHPAFPEENCITYPNGNQKTTGFLHQYGDGDKMRFGLMSGSYAKNLSGGVLRRNIAKFINETNPSDGEVDPQTGIYTNTVGIVKNIDRMRIVDFGRYNSGYEYNEATCGWISNQSLPEGRCVSWGNPIAEMMYESLRYYNGQKQPTPEFNYSGNTRDYQLGLSNVPWVDPYDNSQNESCAKSNLLVISDIYPNYDTDFNIEELTPTTGRFRINFENMEQGGNFDMDAIVVFRYEILSNPEAVRITLENTYEAACLWQHLGYVVSGSTADGIYLDIRQMNEPFGAVNYYLDTRYPLNTSTHTVGRVFIPGTSTATIIEPPFWYAAKWGGFNDKNGNNIPDLTEEWDADQNGQPDNFFLVTNPSQIKNQLGAILNKILAQSSTAASSAVNSHSLNTFWDRRHALSSL